MSGRGRGGRRGGGPRRGPPRGMPPQSRRPNYRRPPPREFQEITNHGKKEIICDSKVILIEFNSNEQGQFMKISETETRNRRVIVNMESAKAMKECLDEIRTQDFPDSSPSKDDDGNDRPTKILFQCKPFDQGRRRYLIDVRSNDRGNFVKLSVNVRREKNNYVAFPLEKVSEVSTGFTDLFEQYCNPQDNESPAPASPVNLPSSREVRAGGKSFYFDVDKNDRGTFVRLTEVIRNYGRRTHINIPNSCWPQMAEVFSQLGQEVPYDEGSGSASGSEDN